MPLTYDAIASTRLTSDAGIISIASIPSTYSDLRVVLSNIITRDGNSTLNLTFNNDTAGNYGWIRLTSGGGQTLSQQNTSANNIDLTNGATIHITNPSHVQIDIFRYAATNIRKNMLSLMANDRASAAGTVNMQASVWTSTAAINRITMSQSANGFIAGTTLTIYGITAA